MEGLNVVCEGGYTLSHFSVALSFIHSYLT